MTVVVRSLFVASLAGSGCAAQPTLASAERCAELLSFRDQSSLDTVALFPGGYVLNEFGGLAGYDMDDVRVFAIPGQFKPFDTTQAGRIVTVSNDDGTVSVNGWSAEGQSLGELSRLKDAAGPLKLLGATIRGDGNVFAYGGTFAQWWNGDTASDPAGTIEISDTVALDDALDVPGGGRYVVTTTITNPLGTAGHTDLSRVDSDGETAWSVPLLVPTEAEAEAKLVGASLMGVVGEDLFLYLRFQVDNDTDTLEVRRYDGSGSMLWAEKTEHPYGGAPGLVHGLASGATLWADRIEDTIRLRVFEEDDTIRCEQRFASHEVQRGVTDIDILDDQLFVMTIDRITRFRLLDVAQ